MKKIKYLEIKDKCKCGNYKCKVSKRCQECHTQGKRKQLSRWRNNDSRRSLSKTKIK